MGLNRKEGGSLKRALGYGVVGASTLSTIHAVTLMPRVWGEEDTVFLDDFMLFIYLLISLGALCCGWGLLRSRE